MKPALSTVEGRDSKPVLSMVEGREAPKRRSLHGRYVLVLALAIFCSGVGLSEERVSFQEVEESLTCQCGCGLTVHSCNHLQCPSAIPLREEIRTQMKEGQDREAILTSFAAKYGEKILSSPTTVGFNLVAWVTPFAVIGLGGVFLGVTLKRWSRRSPTVPEAPPVAPPASPYSKILEKELKDFDA